MEDNNKVNPNPSTTEEQYEEIDIMELVRKCLREWKLILKWCGVAFVVGAIIALSIPKTYTVTSKLAPEIVSKTNSSLSSLASLAGVNLSSGATSDAVYPELYPEIVASKPFVLELFSLPVQFETKRDSVITTDLYTYIKEYNRSPWWSAVISAPFKAMNWFLGLFKEKKEEVEGYANLNSASLTLEQQEIFEAISESMSLTVDKTTALITLSITAQDAKVATDLSDAVISKLIDFVTSYRTEKSRDDLEYYQVLYDEAKAEYYKAQQAYAKYVDANQNVVLQSVLTERERLNNEMQLAYSLYNSTAQQLQMAKAKVQQETPVCVVLEPPTMPTEPTGPSRKMIVLAIVFLAACGSAVWILYGRDWVKKFKETK